MWAGITDRVTKMRTAAGTLLQQVDEALEESVFEYEADNADGRHPAPPRDHASELEVRAVLCRSFPFTALGSRTHTHAHARLLSRCARPCCKTCSSSNWKCPASTKSCLLRRRCVCVFAFAVGWFAGAGVSPHHPPFTQHRRKSASGELKHSASGPRWLRRPATNLAQKPLRRVPAPGPTPPTAAPSPKSTW